MQHELIRRARLGLPIHGPFSRNRRRPRQWSNALPYLISAAAVAGLAALVTGVFFL